MNYMLITVIEREILTEKFPSLEEARQQMMKEFCEYAHINPESCTEVEAECDGEFGYCEWNAYVTDDERGINCDWLIVSL